MRWKNKSLLCIKRDEKRSFVGDIDKFCLYMDNNYKKCGSGSSTICQPKSDPCPITSVEMDDG